jgi:GNAT superfamily N-acetyltransferase
MPSTRSRGPRCPSAERARTARDGREGFASYPDETDDVRARPQAWSCGGRRCVQCARGTPGRVIDIVVATDHRRCGIGTRLMKAVESEARRGHATRIDLASGDERSEAHAFYRSLGYRSSRGPSQSAWTKPRVLLPARRQGGGAIQVCCFGVERCAGPQVARFHLPTLIAHVGRAAGCRSSINREGSRNPAGECCFRHSVRRQSLGRTSAFGPKRNSGAMSSAEWASSTTRRACPWPSEPSGLYAELDGPV